MFLKKQKQMIKTNIPLKNKNWFKTGGNARFYAEPTTAAEFQHALAFAKEQEVPVFILGEGANILISDDGFDGLVIHPQLSAIEHHIDGNNAIIHADAGVSMDTLIDYCLSHQISGLEEFSGIPSSVGGAIFINLHYFQFLISQFLIEAQVIHKDTGKIEIVNNEWFKFGYDYSTLHDGNYFLVSATFKLKRISELEAAYARGRRAEIIRHRNARYPLSHTCGSFFRNFHPHEVTVQSNGKKMIFVAYYLDKIGIKGALSVGDAIVSHQHANMFVNRGNATSTDIIQLARTIQELTQEHFGILPQPECLLVGFNEYPLKKVA